MFGDSSPNHAHFDMQTFSLPSAFATQTLEEIVSFSQAGGGAADPSANAFIAGATVSTTVPDGGSTLALLSWAFGLFVAGRKPRTF